MPDKFAAIYVRVSSEKQDHKSQMPDLERWASEHAFPVKWFRDKFTGKTMDRPGWTKLDAEIESGNISHLVCWKVDRLGRTTVELLQLLRRLRKRDIELVVVTGGIPGLNTKDGRLMFTILAAVAEFDNELRSERVVAGQAVARANGKKWGGSKPGERCKVTELQREFIRSEIEKGTSKSKIAKALNLSRQTIYNELEKADA